LKAFNHVPFPADLGPSWGKGGKHVMSIVGGNVTAKYEGVRL
jgi:hypothetical protein